jgi:hypothetical protein
VRTSGASARETCELSGDFLAFGWHVMILKSLQVDGLHIRWLDGELISFLRVTPVEAL